MAENEFVDVIIPVFNGESTITRALQSVFDQDENLVGSIIVVNDGSTDSTMEVLKELKHSKLRVFSTENHGVASARNYGIGKSLSKWIAFLDADDLWVKDKLRIQINAAKQNKVLFVCCAVGSSIFKDEKKLSQYSLFRGNFIATSSVLLARDLAIKEGPLFNTNMKFAEDYLAWFKILCCSSGYYLSRPLVRYYISAQPHYRPFQVIGNLWGLEKFATKFLYSCRLRMYQKIISWLALNFGIMLSAVSILKRYLRALSI
jgi:glycosyltransferase involved in cell wall biosynthesis